MFVLVNVCRLKEQITPYERILITLFLQVALSALKDPFFPPLLPCGMTLV